MLTEDSEPPSEPYVQLSPHTALHLIYLHEEGGQSHQFVKDT